MVLLRMVKQVEQPEDEDEIHRLPGEGTEVNIYLNGGIARFEVPGGGCVLVIAAGVVVFQRKLYVAGRGGAAEQVARKRSPAWTVKEG
jgi:hypothetical protein